MNISYNNGVHKVEISDFLWSFGGCNNVMKCKQLVLDKISKDFDDSVNKKTWRLWFYK